MSETRRLSKTFSKLSIRRGSTIVLLVADNRASKHAYRMAHALLLPNDELHLLTVVMSEEGQEYGRQLLSSFIDPAQALSVKPVVLVKGDERLGETIEGYVQKVQAHLVITGSHHLCLQGDRANPAPAAGSFALRVVKAITCCPVLVVKVNSRGPYLHSDSTAMGLKVMVDCQSNSRHLLKWLMNQINPEKDGLFLAATKAFDQSTGRRKDTSTRMLTNFSVQASVNDFYNAQRAYKDSAAKVLPQAVEDESIDILAVQAPACKGMPQDIIDLLHSARTSVLVFPAACLAATDTSEQPMMLS